MQLEYALLLYFAGQHDVAIEELKQYRDGMGTACEQIDILLNKLVYLVFENVNW